MKRWVGVLVVALLVLCGGLAGRLWSSLSAEPTAPELAERQAPERRAFVTRARDGFQVSGLVTNYDGEGQSLTVFAVDAFTFDPLEQADTDADGRFALALDRPAMVFPGRKPYEGRAVLVHGAREDLHFIVADLCPLVVEVVDRQGQPIPGASTRTQVDDPTWGRHYINSSADEQGVAAVDSVCGPGWLTVGAEGYATARVAVDTVQESAVRVELGRGVLVAGTVTDESGLPVEAGEAQVFSVYPATPWSGGRFELWVEPGEWNLKVRAEDEGVVGFRQWREDIVVPEQGLELQVVMESFHRVRVYCAGLPDDRCEGVLPIRCDAGMVPSGRVCWNGAEGGETECSCPLAEATVRSPEAQVEVLPDDTEVWLDYRDKGAIVGQVVGCPVPSECAALTGRVAVGLTGSPPVRGAVLDPDGRFELRGLDEGTWGLAVGWPGGVRDLPDVELEEGQVVDLGLIDIGGDGGVAGVVLDGLTGEPVQWETVIVRSRTHDSAVNPLGSMAATLEDGRFELRGLPPGDYDLFLAKRPLERHRVSIDGRLVEGFVLETADANVLDEQGFGVDDELLVTSLDGDGWGAEAGLELGDRVVGVTMMGVDTTMLSPAYSERAAQAVLRHYSGPGLGLVVERDGELYDIALE